ncbi:hypothetical protein RJ639_001844, partial [Escallonia herrerae]
MPLLGSRHHTLIQALLSRGPLKEDDFHHMFSEITGKSPGTDQQTFNDYLRKMNMELSYVQFELRACRNQYDGNVYYGVVNNVSDEQSKLGTKYTVPQIAFYKGIIEAIVQDAAVQGCISDIDALNIRLENQVTGTSSQSQANTSQVPPAFRNFSMSQKENTLEELVQDKWLCKTPDGKVGIGVRSFLDLRSWFRSTDIPACDVCNEAGVKAELCQNENCTVRIHLYCLKRKFSHARVERVCPGCGTEWHYILPKAEALEEQNNANGPSQSDPPPEAFKGKKLRTRKTADVDDVRSGSSQASLHSSETRRITRRSARLS